MDWRPNARLRARCASLQRGNDSRRQLQGGRSENYAGAIDNTVLLSLMNLSGTIDRADRVDLLQNRNHLSHVRCWMHQVGSVSGDCSASVKGTTENMRWECSVKVKSVAGKANVHTKNTAM